MNATEQTGRKIVIVAYRPKPGRELDLLNLTYEHVPLLRKEGLATKREPTICQAADGTVIEVFEWEAGAIERAHTNPVVQELWHRYAEVCTYVPLKTLAETGEMFSEFAPLDL